MVAKPGRGVKAGYVQPAIIEASVVDVDAGDSADDHRVVCAGKRDDLRHAAFKDGGAFCDKSASDALAFCAL